MLSEHERSFRNGGGENWSHFFVTRMATIAENIERQFVPKLMANSWGYVRTIIEVAGVGIIIFVSIILLVNDFDKLKEKASHSIGYRHFVKILKRIFHMGGMFLKHS